jgi:hypothetical protein
MSEYRKALDLAGIPNGPAYVLGPKVRSVVVEGGAPEPSDISLVRSVRSIADIQAEVQADTLRLTRSFISGMGP